MLVGGHHLDQCGKPKKSTIWCWFTAPIWLVILGDSWSSWVYHIRFGISQQGTQGPAERWSRLGSGSLETTGMGHGEETWPQNSNDGLRFLREMALQKSSMGSVNSPISLGRPNNFERHITPRGGLSLLFCVPNWMFLVPININWLRWLVNGSPADSLSLKQRLAASARVWNQPLVDNNLHRSQGQNDSIPKKLGLNPDPRGSSVDLPSYF